MKRKINMSRRQLVENAFHIDKLSFTNSGALVVNTGHITGRSPNAKFIVNDEITSKDADWENNQSLTEKKYKNLTAELTSYVNRPWGVNLYVQRVFAGADPDNRIAIEVQTSTAWQSLFVKNMFIEPTTEELKYFQPEFTVYCVPEFLLEPKVLISFKERKVFISGTKYAGEIKKSVFTILNFLLPKKNILPMHCSVNTDLKGENAAIFFGLSGTGKTTLSSDVNRILIGDDEHGWSENGLYNFEGGCYAKVIRLSEEDEPQIYEACNNFGAVLENVVLNQHGDVDFDNSKYTENTRASYPIEFIKNSNAAGQCGHPKNIIMLTCDAFGVLPPVMKLDSKHAIEQFLLGYTAKVAGTESGVTEPQATFSHCFGSPFMPLKPNVYAKLLKEKIEKHNVNCWLVNTGWTGGPYGIGQRMPISVTRTIIDKILNGVLAESNFVKHEYTDFLIPEKIDSIENKILYPEQGWEDLNAYKEKSQHLLKMFVERLKTMTL